jgi:hypothetical protein
LLAGILAVWRVTHLLHAEDGPGQAVVQLRRRAGDGFWGEVLDCFYCLSVWVALPVALLLGGSWRERILLTAALSGGAILAERLTAPPKEMPMAAYEEDEEVRDVLLRQQTNSVLQAW